jgi:4-hydroxybenzoate polyprenyltransferase
MAGPGQLRVPSEALAPSEATRDGAERAGAAPIALLAWAMAASTFHRILLGEGALIAINVSILLQRGVGFVELVVGATISAMTLAVMYAFNDAYDAVADQHNPKKDQRMVSVYIDYRATSYGIIFLAKAITLGLAWLLLGSYAAAAVAAVLVVNFVYSTMLKGVPIVDVAWCGLWGAAYAAIVTPSTYLIALSGLMTAVCHLYQALGDRSTDAENRITTTAVFSSRLSALVLFVLSAGIWLMLRASLGEALAVSAFIPFALFFALRSSHVAWIMTKVYFGAAWTLVLIGNSRALL